MSIKPVELRTAVFSVHQHELFTHRVLKERSPLYSAYEQHIHELLSSILPFIRVIEKEDRMNDKITHQLAIFVVHPKDVLSSADSMHPNLMQELARRNPNTDDIIDWKPPKGGFSIW